ncbi:MAG: hypothetical protein H7318_02290 [Oligoflexus sp.]|nr:hypothetical protein [Oligoflexus sp.]
MGIILCGSAARRYRESSSIIIIGKALVLAALNVASCTARSPSREHLRHRTVVIRGSYKIEAVEKNHIAFVKLES